jgi:exodeoxyribonuclease V alpha subunit
VGIALPVAGGALQVFFQDESGFRALPPARLPPHQDAFALTVHRAQGSELDDTLLVLPAAPGPVLSRELLYTGLTRARRHVTLVGSAAVVESALRSPTRRHSGLIARLHEAFTC